ncbi:MAG: RNA-guided endonuclease InsQ/TnpB family protein [Candidatus Heimdallarchaeota archaeon]
MEVIRGYRYELKLNNKERSYLRQCAGLSRFAWNWALAERHQRWRDHEGKERFTNAIAQHRDLNARKAKDFPWMYSYSKCIPQEALRDLEQGYQNYRREKKKRLTGKTQNKRRWGLPVFKKKGKCKDSFRLTGAIRVFPKTKEVQLPRMGRVRLKERPAITGLSEGTGRILSATVSRMADRWYVSLQVQETVPDPVPNGAPQIAGLDPGLAHFVTLSNGLQLPAPKWLRRRLRKLRRLSRAVSRKPTGSHNRRKAVLQLACFHQRLAQRRADHHHKLSTWLTQNHGVLVTEDLHVAGLIKNKRLAKAWADLAHGEFRRQLRYKSEWYGAQYVEIPRFYPSSKLCSTCGFIHKDLQLKDRVFCCPLCGTQLDRDVNAALNMEQYYGQRLYLQPLSEGLVAESSAETVNAGGEPIRPPVAGHGSLKQEISLTESSDMEV